MLVLPGIVLLSAVAATSPTGYRTIYPYSVLPGGIAGINVDQARLADPVVAQAWVGVHGLSPAALRAGRYYLQYRNGADVGWTREPRRIAAGEPVMVDQAGNILRERCGNQICSKPRRPYVPFTPPPERDEDTPQVTWIEPPLLAPEWHLYPVPVDLPPAPVPPQERPPVVWVPPVYPPEPPTVIDEPPVFVPPIYIPPPTRRQPVVFPPAVIPEPVSWSLSGVGLALMGLMVWKGRR